MSAELADSRKASVVDNAEPLRRAEAEVARLRSKVDEAESIHAEDSSKFTELQIELSRREEALRLVLLRGQLWASFWLIRTE